MQSAKKWHIHLISVCISLILGGSAWSAIDTPQGLGNKTISPHTFQYLTIPGVDKNLLSLDIYPAQTKNAPVIIFVHGGGWIRGDKSRVHYKPSYFNNLGFTFVSVNYRLSPLFKTIQTASSPVFDPERIKYPVHPSDVSAAYAWIQKNADSLNVDPTRIILMGHSAGSGIVSLIATDPSFITRAGGTFSHLRCTILLDGDAYDIAKKVSEKRNGLYTRNALMYQNAFATPAENAVNDIWKKASAVNYVRPGLGSFFIVTQGPSKRVNSNLDFQKQLNSYHIDTELLDVSRIYNHQQINHAIGDPKDNVITPQLTRFLKTRVLHNTDNITSQNNHN